MSRKRQRVDWWLARRRREWEVTANRYRISFWDNENVLELGRDGGCTTGKIY